MVYLLRKGEALHAQLADVQREISAALDDPDTDFTGVKITERHDIRVKVTDQDALDSYLFRTGRHKLVTSTIRLPGATEQALYDALQMVHGVVRANRRDRGAHHQYRLAQGAAPQDAPGRRGRGWLPWRLCPW